LLALLSFRDFLAIDHDVARCLDADADLRAAHGHHGQFDIVADAKTLTGASGEYQHEQLLGGMEVSGGTTPLIHTAGAPASGDFLRIAVGLC
jgi:hypothetical protein